MRILWLISKSFELLRSALNEPDPFNFSTAANYYELSGDVLESCFTKSEKQVQ